MNGDSMIHLVIFIQTCLATHVMYIVKTKPGLADQAKKVVFASWLLFVAILFLGCIIQSHYGIRDFSVTRDLWRSVSLMSSIVMFFGFHVTVRVSLHDRRRHYSRYARNSENIISR